ncbi:MAG: O-antigen ligase family protein, partial [Candidatus Eremiobacteraeota bacterium]|nr:O-antigen ligase family protein [Candidatus Eremiobacteraeota bacterium]
GVSGLGGVVLATPHRTALDPVAIALFALVAMGVAIATVRRPAYGVAALLVLDPFAWAHDVGPTQLTLGKLALAGLIVGLALRRSSPGALWDARTRPLVGGACAIVVATALTALPAVYIDAVARAALKAVEYLAAFCATTVAVAADAAAERPLTVAMLGVGAVVCLLAVAQYATGAPSGTLVDGHVVPRIAGPLEGPNQLAGYLDFVLPIALVLALRGGRTRPAALTVFVLAAVTDLLTLSRAGLVGALVAVAVAFVATRGTVVSRRLVVPATALGALLVAGAIRLGFAARLLSDSEVVHENGLGTRAELWPAALRLFASDPALGIGAGNFELRLPSVGLVGVRTHANSLYLQSLAEGGIALFAATAWTIGAAVTLCLRNSSRSPLVIGIGAGSVGFAVHQVFDVLTFFPKVGEMWWILLGIAAGTIAKTHGARLRS